MRCYVRCYTAIHKWFQKIQKYDDNEKRIFLCDYLILPCHYMRLLINMRCNDQKIYEVYSQLLMLQIFPKNQNFIRKAITGFLAIVNLWLSEIKVEWKNECRIKGDKNKSKFFAKYRIHSILYGK